MNQSNQSNLPLILNFRPKFEDVPDHQALSNSLREMTQTRRTRVRNWREFTDALRDETPALITIWHEVMQPGLGVAAFIAFVRGLLQYMDRNINWDLIPIAISIDHTCSQQFVAELQKTSCGGVYFPADIVGVENSARAITALQMGEYWPEDIIQSLPSLAVPSKVIPNIVYFNNGLHEVPLHCTTQLSEQLGCTYTVTNNWQTLTKELEDGSEYIAFHIDVLDSSKSTYSEFIDSITTISKYMPKVHQLRIGVVIKRTTPLKTVKALQKTAVSCLLLDIRDWPIEEVGVATLELVNGRSYWPKAIIAALPGNATKTATLTNNARSLTERQQEVLNLVCNRGLTNKQIAKALSLSESTVKIHVSAVMRAHGVRNRTQLALAASSGLHA